MWEMFWLIASLTALSFGGGNTMLGALERVLVQSGRMDPAAFAFAIAVGQSTPGPLATYTSALGMTLYGMPGALGATLGIVSVSVVAVLLILRIPQAWFHAPVVRAALTGVAPFIAGLALYLGGRILFGDGMPPAAGMLIALVVAVLRWKKVPAAPLVVAAALVGMFLQK